MAEKKKVGRPSTPRSRAAASRERALAHLRWLQVRQMRRELVRRVDVEATISRMLGMIRDRMLALPDHMPELGHAAREALRKRIAATLEACSKAEL